MDLLLWLTGKTCESVSSFGDTYLFKPQCAPEGAALRCLDGCKAKDHCPFDAEKIYLKDPKIGVENGYTQWPVNVLTLHPTVESVTQAIQNGPYGRCVYHCQPQNDRRFHHQPHHVRLYCNWKQIREIYGHYGRNYC